MYFCKNFQKYMPNSEINGILAPPEAFLVYKNPIIIKHFYIMKKLLLLLGVALFTASCTTTVKTAKTADSSAQLLSATVADLEVSPERITYTMVPKKTIRRGGEANVKQAAEQEALLKYGNADVLVDAEYSIAKTSYFIFGSKISSITVTGRPAKYTNFHSLNDSVWCNRAFREGYKNQTKKSGESVLRGLFRR